MHTKYYARLIWWSLITFCLDRLTKQWALMQGLSIVRNTGMSFGMCSGWCYAQVCSIGCGVVLIGALIILSVYAHTQRFTALPLGLVLGGALSNLLDRFIFGGVIDFIDLNVLANSVLSFIYSFTTLPWCNLADVAIVGGALWFCIAYFYYGETI